VLLTVGFRVIIMVKTWIVKKGLCIPVILAKKGREQGACLRNDLERSSDGMEGGREKTQYFEVAAFLSVFH